MWQFQTTPELYWHVCFIVFPDRGTSSLLCQPGANGSHAEKQNSVWTTGGLSKSGNTQPLEVVALTQGKSTFLYLVKQLLKLLTLRGNTPGPLFAYPTGETITHVLFNTNFNACLKFLGMDSAGFKGHRFRIGAATEAAASGLSDVQIGHLERWRSDAYKGYIIIQ